MNIQACIQFANENPICYFATVEKDQPRVRVLGFWFADETGFYFQTGVVKELPNQLKENPKAEVCFYKQDGALGTMLRISGKVEFVNTTQLKEKALVDRPFLKDMGMTSESPDLILFKINHGEAHFWTMGNNTKPKELIHF